MRDARTDTIEPVAWGDIEKRRMTFLPGGDRTVRWN
jgi:hypothetical protein